MKRYCPSLFNYTRRPSIPVRINRRVTIGGDYPVAIQSMTTTDTADTEASAAQVRSIAAAGADLVRLTAQGRTEAERLLTIRRRIEEKECYVPLVADIHFNPQAALIAAQYVSKVRINPGNFIDKRANFTHIDYTDAEYRSELDRLSSRMHELLEVCRQYGTALRIGVNHGSLSDRIMSRYGDTTDGMVESAMEFLRICRDENFNRMVISMKSSNTRVMVEAYRKLIVAMDAEDMHYPLHLGVTEAGEGDDGRIRSAVGIGALMADGIGDTIRVSLTEPPEHEIRPACILADYFVGRDRLPLITEENEPIPYNPYAFHRRETTPTLCNGLKIGGGSPPVVIGEPVAGADLSPDDLNLISPRQAMTGTPGAVVCTLAHLTEPFIGWLSEHSDRIIVVVSEHPNWVGEVRAALVRLMRAGLSNPVILSRCYDDTELDQLQIHAAADFGALLIDGLGDGIWIVHEPDSRSGACDPITDQDVVRLSLGILQASRMRISRTEIISCPGCGRTLFDLQQTARAVKERFGNYPGLKIAVMGCIVNGPGEMADADFGYVGAGGGRVTLYRGKEVVERNIPQDEALDRLEQMIRTHLKS